MGLASVERLGLDPHAANDKPFYPMDSVKQSDEALPLHPSTGDIRTPATLSSVMS